MDALLSFVSAQMVSMVINVNTILTIVEMQPVQTWETAPMGSMSISVSVPKASRGLTAVSYTHLTLPTTPYV